MKRIIFTLLVVITAGMVTSAYSQVSIRASINLGHTGIYVKSAPVAYEPACAPAPPPPCYDNGYNTSHIQIVIGRPGYDRRYYDERSKEIRYNERDRGYRDHDNRDRDRRDSDRGHDGWGNR